MKKKKADRNKAWKPRAKAKASKRAVAGSKLTAKRKPTPTSKTKRAKKPVRRPKMVERGSREVETVRLQPKGLGTRAGVGAGDFTGVSIAEDADSESPEELLEEGQAFEAGIVSGVENAADADEAEVTTHEVRQDDVPEEYDDKDRP